MDEETRAKVEQVGNAAAEDGDPDVVEIARRALDGEAHFIGEALEAWTLWNARGRFVILDPEARSLKPEASRVCEAFSDCIPARRAAYRRRTLETFLLYLFTYEMPLDRVRTLLDKVETQALRGFPDLEQAGLRSEFCAELCERLTFIEHSFVQRESGGRGPASPPLSTQKSSGTPGSGPDPEPRAADESETSISNEASTIERTPP